MRKLVVSNVMSLDGYVNADTPEPQLPIGASAEIFNSYNAELLRSASTLLVGRNSYELFEGYWPSVEHDESADPVERDISRSNSRVDKIVVSNTYTISDDSPWAASTQVVRRDAAAALLEKTKQDDGGDIVVFGSATTWNALLAAGVVDELHLIVTPIVLGRGVPAFTTAVPDELRLLEVKRFDDSSTVVLVYAGALGTAAV